MTLPRFSKRLMTQHERLVAETLALCAELKSLMNDDLKVQSCQRHHVLRQKIKEHRRQIRMHVAEWRKSRG